MGGCKPEGCLRKLSETCLKVFVVVLKRGGGDWRYKVIVLVTLEAKALTSNPSTAHKREYRLILESAGIRTALHPVKPQEPHGSSGQHIPKVQPKRL